ncbi:E3 ubiquitin-protein ligase TRIM71-like [Anneissia japonica]|uniref:E3 ubiquitin-protein ligase TRIM71-like n=1 Tax=Anneissia japonica TaxID=1529436 RepID=UPI001425BB08|nr:E3 ubiquitin-protein ligase TRIM71-like [Anneissia japonica]
MQCSNMHALYNYRPQGVEGNHKPISISEAFQTFKETSAALEKVANDCKKKLQGGLRAVIQATTKLNQSKDKSLSDIDNHVQKMLKEIKENGDKLKNEVQTIYKEKKEMLDVQMDELKKTISDINTKLNFLNQLLKSDEATAMQSSEIIITALEDRIDDLPETETKDYEQLNFYTNKNQIESLQACDIGYISEMRAADCLKLKEREVIVYGIEETIFVHIIGAEDIGNKLKATWKIPTGETIIGEFYRDWYTIYATLNCRDLGIYELDVRAYGESIENSPMTIKVEPKLGLVNTIKTNKKNVRDVYKCEDGCLLVSCGTNEILKYKQSGEYIGKVTIPQGVGANRIYKMKNGNITFSDLKNKCIKVCNMNGELVKSIGQGVLKFPTGIHVDEKANIVYVGDWNICCVFMFDIDSGQMIRKTGSQGNQRGQMGGVIDVTLTSEGNLLVLEYDNRRLQLFDNEGHFKKVLVEAGDENGKLMNPCGVVVDEDDNIIISSNHKLQLFSSDGYFLQRIDEEGRITNPHGLSIISYHPLKVAVANTGDGTIKIFNYHYKDCQFSNFIMNGMPC